MAMESMASDSPDVLDEFLTRFDTADGVFAVDLRQRIVHWSRRAQELLGYRPEDVVGKPCYEVLGGRDSRNYLFCRRDCPVMVNSRRGRTTPDYDILCTLPSGQEKWLNVSIVVPKESRGRLQVLHFCRDVSRRRRIEESARQASAALRPLLDGEGNADIEARFEPSPTPPPKLSRREMDVLRLLATGASTRQIADALSIRTVTARNHITRLLTKLGVESRLQAVVYASKQRLM